MFPSPRRTSPALRRRHSVLASSSPASERVLGRPLRPRPKAPRLSFLALQHTQVRGPFFSVFLRRPSGRRCLVSRKSRPQGLATLSADSAPELLETSFSLRRSWASPYRALLLPGDRIGLSPDPLRPCTFSRNHFGLGPVLRRFAPTGKAAPLCATGGIKSGRGPGSPGLGASQALSSRLGSEGCLSLRMSLSVLAAAAPRGAEWPHPQGVSKARPGIFPHGTPACLASPPTALAVSSKP